MCMHRYLYLQGNTISALSSNTFESGGKLRELDLSGNMISALPLGVFDQLTSLKNLYLHCLPGQKYIVLPTYCAAKRDNPALKCVPLKKDQILEMEGYWGPDICEEEESREALTANGRSTETEIIKALAGSIVAIAAGGSCW